MEVSLKYCTEKSNFKRSSDIINNSKNSIIMANIFFIMLVVRTVLYDILFISIIHKFATHPLSTTYSFKTKQIKLNLICHY